MPLVVSELPVHYPQLVCVKWCDLRHTRNVVDSYFCVFDICLPKRLFVIPFNTSDLFFFLLALQPPSGVVFYSPLAGFSLLAYEVS